MGVEPAVFQSVSQKRAASSGTELFKRGLGNPQQAAFGSLWLSKGIACHQPGACVRAARLAPPKTKTPVHPKRLYRSLRVKMVIVK